MPPHFPIFTSSSEARSATLQGLLIGAIGHHKAGTLRASYRLVELIDASSESVSLDAAKHALAIEGIKPPDSGGVSVSIHNNVGYVVDWRSDRGGQVIDGHAQPMKALETKD
jgi:hypothetical protein